MTMSSRLKVLYVSSVRFFSGSEVLLAEFLRENDSINPVLAAPEGPLSKVSSDAGVRVQHVPSLRELTRREKFWWPFEFLVRTLAAFIRLSILIIREKPAVVHANNFAAALYALLPARLFRKPFIWHIYDIFPRGSLESRVIRTLTPMSTTLVVPSGAVAESLPSNAARAQKLIVLHNGVDCFGRFDPMRYEYGSVREDLGIPRDALVVAMCSQLVEWKGLHILLDAIELLEAISSDVRYLIAGSAPQDSQSYLAAQQQRVARSDFLQERVLFTGWRADLPQVIRDIDVLVVPSVLPDPLPTIVIESMSLGKPVIGSRIGGIPEMIDDGKTGLLIEPSNATELSAKLLWVASHTDEVKEMGRKARERVIAEFSLDRYRREILRVYRDVSRPRS